MKKIKQAIIKFLFKRFFEKAIRSHWEINKQLNLPVLVVEFHGVQMFRTVIGPPPRR